MIRPPLGRRDFLKRTGGLALFSLSPVGKSSSDSESRIALTNPVGYATIGWPESQFSHALEIISKLGFQGVQLLGWTRDAHSGEKAKELRARLEELRLRPVALSCSSLELGLEYSNPAEQSELRAYACFFQQLGGAYLQITDGGRPEGDYSPAVIRNLGARMNSLGRVARDFGTTLGYHPHFGTYGETREGLGRILDATDPHDVKLIADVAHLTLGGSDPAEVIRTYHERLIVVHFKDVRKEVLALARRDRPQAHKSRHHFCEIGLGAVNFPPILEAFREIDYRGWIVIELDNGDEGPWGPGAAARKNQEAARQLGLKV